MNPSNMTDDWIIYNCHIHTFTRQHSPRQFIKWVLSDSELGRINWVRVPFYLLLVVLYIFVLVFLARFSIFLSTRSDLLSLLGYPFVLLTQAVLVIPIVLLVGILAALGLIVLLQGIIDLLIKMRSVSQSPQADSQLMQLKNTVARGRRRVIRSNLLINLLVRINPASNDIFERTARFLKIAEQPTQWDVFRQVELQYPKKTVFVVLPMDMGFMNLGKLEAPIDRQHDELWNLAECYQGRIIPFYAADPRHEDIVERVRNNLARDKFRGIKIYPNLGYRPDDPKLMEIYKICIEGDFPVLTHCSPGGIWQYGLSKKDRRANSHPINYKRILDMPGYQNLKLCLAHFGGAEEWKKHLQGRAQEAEEESWVRTIYEMIASGNYPNLYADISYTVFTPKVQGLYIDLVDYLKVLLAHPLVRKRVLFGSDYYMVERESISEKEVSLLLRSRLGEDLFKQIAYTNPREFLGIEVPAATTIGEKTSTQR
ncbi:MAG TPA: amidohydrolase family protein [Anaerolineales bacterium]|nr:amidohydrolase family protein [Anaerolineales bacterium]